MAHEDKEQPANKSSETLLQKALVKDRSFVLKIEADFCAFVNSFSGPEPAAAPSSSTAEYLNMNSYQRLLIHRIADTFDLAHVFDSTRFAVLIFMKNSSFIPKDLMRDRVAVNTDPRTSPDILNPISTAPAPLPTKLLARRTNSASSVNNKQVVSQSAEASSKLLDARAREYVETRQRIFDGEEPLSNNSSVAADHQQNQYQSKSVVRDTLDFRPRPPPVNQQYYQYQPYYPPYPSYHQQTPQQYFYDEDGNVQYAYDFQQDHYPGEYYYPQHLPQADVYYDTEQQDGYYDNYHQQETAAQDPVEDIIAGVNKM